MGVAEDGVNSCKLKCSETRNVRETSVAMELGGNSGLEGDPYAGYVVDDSDLEYSECSEADSSGDEFVFTKTLIGKPQSKVNRAEEVDSDGEFEREMDDEANRLLQLVTGGKSIPGLTTSVGPSKTPPGPNKGLEDPRVDSGDQENVERKERKSVGQQVEGCKEGQFYDDVYFDSSDEELDGDGREKARENGSHAKVRKLTNDELFYDPSMDAEDEKWVERQRMAYHNVRVSAELMKVKKDLDQDKPSPVGTNPSSSDTGNNSYPNSDAVLNCPACMSTLCLDCQRHETYSNQYRAMFVLNCKIITDEVLKYHPKQKRKRKRHKAQQAGEEQREDEEQYRPVRCSICDTEVAVYDKEEIFHFFNVLASTP